jgi:hypothetical protein
MTGPDDAGRCEGRVTKTFTLNEAQTLLPVLESLLRRAQAAASRASELDQEMQELSQRIFLAGGMHVNVALAARRRAERDKSSQEAKDTLAEIDAIGVRVQDFKAGLLDFPCAVEGRMVLLCWRLGEPVISHWHSEEDGFEGRKPVEMLFGKGERERLN